MMDDQPAPLEDMSPRLEPDPVRRLRRSRSDRMLAGICGGLGDYFGVDPVAFRILFVLLALPGGLPGLLPYILMWIVIPEE
jgi:phage shock protein PspC (stress-responsive transcriptional regulator)